MSDETAADYRTTFLSRLENRDCAENCSAAKAALYDLGLQVEHGHILETEAQTVVDTAFKPSSCSGQKRNPNYGGGCSEREYVCGHELGATALGSKWKT